MKTKTTMYLLGLSLATCLSAGAQQGGSSSGTIQIQPPQPTAPGQPQTGSGGVILRQEAGPDGVFIETSGPNVVMPAPRPGGPQEGPGSEVRGFGSGGGGGSFGFAGASTTGGFSGSGPGDPAVRWTYSDGGMSGSDFGINLKAGPRTYLGVAATPVSPQTSSQISLPENTGLVVNHIEEGSAAQKAGLQTGDILAKLDDQILILPAQLSVLVANKKEGETVKLTFLRKGQIQQADAVLTTKTMPEGPQGTIRIGDADVVIDGAEGRPLRTFMRTFQVPPIPPGSGPESSGATASDPAEHSKELNERLEKLQRAVEELQKSIK